MVQKALQSLRVDTAMIHRRVAFEIFLAIRTYSAQRVGYALHGVHDGADHVVGGVGLVLSARTMVRRVIGAVQHGVAQRAIITSHIQFGAQAPLLVHVVALDS